MNPSYNRVKRWRKNNPKKYRQQQIRHNEVYYKIYYKKKKNTIFRNILLKRYGLTQKEYLSILKSQNNVCAICLKKCTSKKRLAVDHCHTTNTNRGLLCKNCNIGLGMFADDPQLLCDAVKYLEKYKCV